jgi:hypothetical protein
MHYQFSPDNQWGNVQAHLNESIHLKHPKLWVAKDWVFLHKYHGTLVTTCAAATCQAWYCSATPWPYSPNLVMYNFCLFFQMEDWLKNSMEIQVGLNIVLQDITYGGFLKCFNLLYNCQKHVAGETQNLKAIVSKGRSASRFKTCLLHWNFLKLPCIIIHILLYFSFTLTPFFLLWATVHRKLY